MSIFQALEHYDGIADIKPAIVHTNILAADVCVKFSRKISITDEEINSVEIVTYSSRLTSEQFIACMQEMLRAPARTCGSLFRSL